MTRTGDHDAASFRQGRRDDPAGSPLGLRMDVSLASADPGGQVSANESR